MPREKGRRLRSATATATKLLSELRDEAMRALLTRTGDDAVHAKMKELTKGILVQGAPR